MLTKEANDFDELLVTLLLLHIITSHRVLEDYIHFVDPEAAKGE